MGVSGDGECSRDGWWHAGSGLAVWYKWARDILPETLTLGQRPVGSLGESEVTSRGKAFQVMAARRWPRWHCSGCVRGTVWRPV